MPLSAPPAAPVIEPAPERIETPAEIPARNPGELQAVPLSARAREWLRILHQALDAQQPQEPQSPSR